MKGFFGLAALSLMLGGGATPALAHQPPCNEQGRWYAQAHYQFDTDEYWAMVDAYVDSCIVAYPTTGGSDCGNTFVFTDPNTGKSHTGYVPCF